MAANEFFKHDSNDGRVSLSGLILVSVFDFEFAWNWLYIPCSPFKSRNTSGVKASGKCCKGSNELSFKGSNERLDCYLYGYRQE